MDCLFGPEPKVVALHNFNGGIVVPRNIFLAKLSAMADQPRVWPGLMVFVYVLGRSATRWVMVGGYLPR